MNRMRIGRQFARDDSVFDMGRDGSYQMRSMAGYSSTPLAKKLGLKPGSTLWAVNAPQNYAELLAPMPEDVKVVPTMSPAVDVFHIFTKSRISLEDILKKTLAKMRANASIWVSWPKKASKVETDITEDVVRAVALPLGLVDIKVCAVDEVWSGLKLMIRLENRAGRP